MPVLAVEISAGTKELLTRRYREETNDYSPKGIESDDFDDWFSKWLNVVLFEDDQKKKATNKRTPEQIKAQLSQGRTPTKTREQEITEMDNDPRFKK